MLSGAVHDVSGSRAVMDDGDTHGDGSEQRRPGHHSTQHSPDACTGQHRTAPAAAGGPARLRVWLTTVSGHVVNLIKGPVRIKTHPGGSDWLSVHSACDLLRFGGKPFVPQPEKVRLVLTAVKLMG